MATSTQDMVQPGECVDIYYYDGKTHEKQCFPTTQNTKYVVEFANLEGGSSVFTVPPNFGVQDVVINFKMPNISSNTGLALGRGWGYALIKQVSFRYGGSSQFFLTGDQILQNALRRQPNRVAANDILSLGGAALAEAGLATDTNYANIVLTLPHSIPSGVGKQLPFPTDLLTQQLQITCELNSVASIFSNNGGTAPTKLDSAQFQIQQVVLNNAGDALARRVDMAENAYAFPCEFVQQKQVIGLASNAGSQSVVLTGFRSGEVKNLQCWITKDSDTSGATKNFNYWYLPTDIQMTYAGDIYARYQLGSSPLWNLINGNKSPAVDTVSLSWTGSNYDASPAVSAWVELPFAQTHVDEDSHNTLVHGKPITNGIVNLDLTTQTAASDYKLNVSYVYNTTLLMSQGTADYVF